MLTAFGYIFIAASALLLRQVAVGRVDDTVTDFRDFSVAFLNGDMDAVREVSGRRGENIPELSPSGGNSGMPTSTLGGSSALLDEVRSLGESANGYQWGATGPTYYDCSGIVWRAVKKMGIYNGPRFTTSTFASAAKGFATKVDSPQVGDILVWPGKHMGISTGGDGMYSARSREKGITNSSVSGDSSYFGSSPVVWRLTTTESV